MFFSTASAESSKRQPLLGGESAGDEENGNQGDTRLSSEEDLGLRRQTYADQVFEDELAITHRVQETSDEHEDVEPAFSDDSKRKMTPAGGVFTLMASMLGGAMLTLPFATARVGVAGSLFISLCSALASDSSYYFLVEASRETKKNTYHAIGQVYFGQAGKIVSILSLVMLTLFASMGYLLLLGLLVGEMVSDEDSAPSRRLRNIVSVIFALCLAPLCASKSLHALRYSNMFSVLSAILLLVSVLVEAIKAGKGFHRNRRDPGEDGIKWYSDSLDDIVYAVPFFVGAYMAHFSMLTVHAELIRPTQRRVRTVIRTTLVSAWVLYSAIGVLGYMYALDGTCDSVFSNLPKDVLTIFGRIGLVATLAFSYPLFIVPCRGALKDLFLSVKGLDSNENAEKSDWEAWFDTDRIRRGLTVVLVTISATMACVIPSVAVFISFIGSTVGTVLAFLFPGLFYLKLSPNRKHAGYVVLSYIFICLAIFLMTFGTWTSVLHSSDEACAEQK